MRIRVYPYKMASEGGKAVAKPLPALRVRQNGLYRPRTSDLIINWGSTKTPSWARSNLTVLNPWDKIKNATNKIKAFNLLSAANIPVPRYTTSRDEALSFFADNGIVVCRTTVTGSRGAGIVIAKTPEELVNAPLYTRHVRHKNEYRVHVVGNTIIDFAQKKKRQGSEASALIRSHGDGVFCRDGISLPDTVKQAALGAIQALGLDFGAIDLGHRVSDDKAYVFEVNTAPGMSATSNLALRYVAAFRNLGS